MRRLYKPLFPDRVGDSVRLVRGTGGRYGISANGNLYRVDGAKELEEKHFPPLRPERTNDRRDLPRVRIRFLADAKKKTASGRPLRPYHSLTWLVFRAYMADQYPEAVEGKWTLYHKNVNQMDTRPENIGVTTERIRERRTKLNKKERAMARSLLRSGKWTHEEIAHAFVAQISVIDRIAEKAGLATAD